MKCCQLEGIEEMMDAETAADDMRQYRQNGAARTTEMLLSALRSEGVEGRSLLDIGGGVGAIQHELLKSGVTEVVSVDASSAYLNAAREQAEKAGHRDRITQYHGDFVAIADVLDPADIVTLDRVICCYDDMPELVKRSTALASHYYGLVYPRDGWLFRAVAWLGNLFFRLRGSQFRAFINPTVVVDGIIRRAGFDRIFSDGTFIWQVHLYARPTAWANSS